MAYGYPVCPVKCGHSKKDLIKLCVTETMLEGSEVTGEIFKKMKTLATGIAIVGVLTSVAEEIIEHPLSFLEPESVDDPPTPITCGESTTNVGTPNSD